MWKFYIVLGYPLAFLTKLENGTLQNGYPPKWSNFSENPFLFIFFLKINSSNDIYMPFYGYLSHFGHFLWITPKKREHFWGDTRYIIGAHKIVDLRWQPFIPNMKIYITLLFRTWIIYYFFHLRTIKTRNGGSNIYSHVRNNTGP